MMALLRVLEVHVMGNKPDDTSVMNKYIRIRFNNIVAFEAWQKRQTLEILWKSAIQKTLHELKVASIYELQLWVPIDECALEEILDKAHQKLEALYGEQLKKGFTLSMLQKGNEIDYVSNYIITKRVCERFDANYE